ncbi:MOSC domain-containing protein [Haladaptatus sp. GCM10025707]|uniref:MOSC domain-containing protein n=1 Tax=unclassified Haladaptatus TaxID=2622732 RepID=UPI0023E8487E|nr:MULTISPECIES: MOSC N-terminal beta barrel domain-containing protein [unclassified Haladaptatus]
MTTPRLDRLTVYPIKSLDGIDCEAATLVENGGLEHDRQYAIVDEAGHFVNGKRTASIHRLRLSMDLETNRATIRRHGSDQTTARAAVNAVTGHLDDHRDRFESWLSAYFERPVALEKQAAGGFPDDTEASGPTVISTETLFSIASWYDLPVENVRRRFRANLELGSCPAFWEDHLYGPPGSECPFEIGDVAFAGTNPCQRCVVPTRDPDTGESTPDFRKTFVNRREASLPDWANREQFDHFFRVMVNTTVPETEWGKQLSAGDTVSL